jgi:hypothetical protein
MSSIPPHRSPSKIDALCYVSDYIALKSNSERMVGGFGATIGPDSRHNGGFCRLGTPCERGIAVGSHCRSCSLLCAFCKCGTRSFCGVAVGFCRYVACNPVWPDEETALGRRGAERGTERLAGIGEHGNGGCLCSLLLRLACASYAARYGGCARRGRSRYGFE